MRVGSNFWEQRRFSQIRVQILNNSERQNYMKALQRSHLKGKYIRPGIHIHY